MTPHQALDHFATRNDAEAFRLLVHEYQHLVYAAAKRRLAHAHDIEDVVQITFLKLARSASTLRRNGHGLATWLYTTALNSANDFIRADASRRRHESQLAQSIASAASTIPQDVDEWQKLSLLIDEIILQLPNDQQVLIVEHFFHNQSQRDLAAHLRTSQSTIKRRLAAAVDNLRQHLHAQGYSATPAALAAGMQSLTPPATPATLAASLTKIGLAGAQRLAGPGTQAALPLFALSLGAKITLSVAAACAVVALIVIPTLRPPHLRPPAPPTTQVSSPLPAPPPDPNDPLANIDYTHITVDLDNLSGRQALAAFSNQTGYNVTSIRPLSPTPPVSLHLKDRPLLDGFFQLVNQTDSGIVQLGPSSATIQNGIPIKKPGPYTATGPFAVMLDPNGGQPIRFQGNPRHINPAWFHLDMYVEPQVQNILFPNSVTLDPCTDDLHQPITRDDLFGISDHTMPYPDLSFASLQVDIILPDSPGKEIPVLKGKVLYNLITNSQSFTTQNPTDHLQENLGDAAVEILPFVTRHPQDGAAPRVGRGGGGGGGGGGGAPSVAATPADKYETTVIIRRNQMKQETWDAQLEWIRQSRVTIFNGSDQPIRFNRSGALFGRETKDSVTLTYLTFGAPAEGAATHIQLTIPTQTRPLPVPFEFKNVPLPSTNPPPTTAPAPVLP